MFVFFSSLFEIETGQLYNKINLNFSFIYFREKKTQEISKIEFDFEFRLTCYLFIWLAITLIVIFLAWYRYGYSIIQQLSKTRKIF